MAKFKYMGEIPNGFVVQYGPCLEVKVPLKDGTKLSIPAPDQSTGFLVGQDLGVDITDERALRYLRADARFQEIL